MEETPDPDANPFDRVVDPWEQVIDDMHATAERYRESGTSVVECHPGDVATLTGQPRTAAELSGEQAVDAESRRLGLDVVVPGDEFEAVQAALSDQDVTDVEVYHATENDVVFLLFSLECGDTVVFVPAYYDQSDREALARIAREYGLQVHVRPLADDEVVTIELEDPDPCFPDDV